MEKDVGVYPEKRCRGCIMERERNVGSISWKEMQGVYHGKRCRVYIMERDAGGVSWKEM